MSWLERIFGAHALEPELAPPRGDPERVRAVNAVIDELRPMFAADGGEVQLVAIEDDVVLVRLRGACRTCTASDLSLQGALEPRLKERCAWVRGVRAI
jgi:Fe-S cluster biogenesis protein NfuA